MKYWNILKTTFKEFSFQDAMSYSSSIAFYLMFSLPAILIISISIAGFVYDSEVASRTLIQQFETFFGDESADAINKILQNITQDEDSVVASIVGFITLLVSATTVFVSLQDGINNIWGIESEPDKNLYNMIKNRLISLAMAVSIGFLLLVTLVVDAVLSFFDEQIINLLTETGFFIATLVNFGLSIFITTAIFAALFKTVPKAIVKWKNVFMGAFITTILFTIGKYVIGFYLGNSSFGSVYGAAGSLVVLLTWIFYSSMMVLFGAQFTAEYSKEIEGGITTKKNSTLIHV